MNNNDAEKRIGEALDLMWSTTLDLTDDEDVIREVSRAIDDIIAMRHYLNEMVSP